MVVWLVLGRVASVPLRRAGWGLVGGMELGCDWPWWRVLVPTVGARPSQQPGSAQQPSCELGSTVGGALLLSYGFFPRAMRVRPARASVASRGQGRHLLAGGDSGVPGHAAGDDDEELPQERGGDRGAGLAVA